MKWLDKFKKSKKHQTKKVENQNTTIGLDVDPMQLIGDINQSIETTFLADKKENTKDYKTVKKEIERLNAYIKQIQPTTFISDTIGGLKDSPYTVEGLYDCAGILEYTALPPSTLRIMAQDPLVALAVETLANQAARDLPTLSIYSLTNYSPDQSDYTYLNEYVYNRLVESKISKVLRESVMQSKVYGAVNILKMPTVEKSEEYWNYPFNIESIGKDTEINFELIIPENMTPYYRDDFDNIYEEPTYWKIFYRGAFLIVHKTHLIRVIENPQYGAELVRYQYRGKSLVEAIYPVAKTARNLENKRSHLILIKGVVAINIPTATANQYSMANCGGKGNPFSVFATAVAKISEMMNTTVARSNLIALPEGAELKNIDISLSDVNDNIDSYYRRLSALSSLPLSTLGLTPPRGINDSGAVEADGSRRAIETNQSIILRPILLEIVRIYAKQGMWFITDINESIDELGFDIEFQANDAPTAVEEVERAAKWVEIIGALVDRKIVTKQSALEILTTQVTVAFDNAVGMPAYEEDYDKESAEAIFKQLELDADELIRKERGEQDG